MELMQRRRKLMTFEHGHWATATGSIATFNTPFAKPFRLLKTEFMPVQEGTGDPSPDNVRPITGWTGMTLYHASKNIFSSTIEQGSFNSSTGAEVTSSSRIRSKYVPISAGTFTVSNSSGLDTVVYAYDTNQSFLSDESVVLWQGSAYTFTVTKAKYVRFAWKNSAGSTITPSSISGIQLECGSAATTYEPYNGTTIPVTFPAVGKNLIPDLKYQYLPSQVVLGQNSGRNNFGIHLAAGTYTFTVTSNVSASMYLNVRGWADARWIGNTSTSATFTLEEDSDIELFLYKSSGISTDDVSSFMLETGSTATAYEPYTNTVYGGYVDLVKGVLTATHVLVDFKKWTTLGYGAGNGSVWFFSSNYSPALKKYAGGTAANAYCDKLKVDKYDSFSMKNSNDLRIALDSAGRVRFRYNALSGSEHKEDMYAVLYGLSFIAPLDTPITYQLTPQQITALVGTNNIWSTANGNVTAEYFTR